MGAKRKARNNKLPKFVYNNNGTLVYRPSVNGKLLSPIRLGKANMPMSELWSAYESLTNNSVSNLHYLVHKYMEGDHFKTLKSRKSIEQAFDRLLSASLNNGSKQFRHLLLKDISPGVIRKYLDKRNNVSGNREVSYLSAAWSWCYERDFVTYPNPCKGVKKKHNAPRSRYVTDEEFNIVFNLAPKYIKVMMKLAYLCRMRSIEVLDTRVKDLTTEGLYVRRTKSSKDAITKYSQELTDAINMGLEGCIRVPEMPIVNNGKGGEVKMEAFRSAWQRLMRKAVKTTNIKRFTYHDLKAKGVSDSKEDKMRSGGFKSQQMISVYDRKLMIVEATK